MTTLVHMGDAMNSSSSGLVSGHYHLFSARHPANAVGVHPDDMHSGTVSKPVKVLGSEVPPSIWEVVVKANGKVRLYIKHLQLRSVYDKYIYASHPKIGQPEPGQEWTIEPTSTGRCRIRSTQNWTKDSVWFVLDIDPVALQEATEPVPLSQEWMFEPIQSRS
ncbi:hypothetical protein [Nocardia gamkensis]|uniref:Uncharacterized protein n=1 Tax=Nocardia gamkensis TaxID=352869 RepID=A0A7X6R783_9NOCA|nr:hypothetical protein [Nocardia gamkensis]NKY31328.1 hypothetical protein [Nocardia gamkensis]